MVGHAQCRSEQRIDLRLRGAGFTKLARRYRQACIEKIQCGHGAEEKQRYSSLTSSMQRPASATMRVRQSIGDFGMAITISTVRETVPGERRVALTPDVAKKLKAKAVNLLLEHDAGKQASFPDAVYKDTEIAADAGGALSRADVLLKVQPPSLDEIAKLKPGSVYIGYLQPHLAPERIKALRDAKVTSFAMELLPRTTRAQAMDVLSSQANIAGYKAVLIAAEASPKFFPMLNTATSTVRPSKVLIVGAGVAGLQAIATARRLGAQGEGF